jgi:hypothetical protein
MATKFEVLLSAKLDDNSVKDIQKQLDSISKGTTLKINADSSQVNNLKQSLTDLGNSAKEAKTHTQGLDDIIQKFSSWQIVGDVIHGVKDAMQDMVQQVFDLDESLTELDKVTDLTSGGLQNLADDAFEVGEQIGATRQRCHRCHYNLCSGRLCGKRCFRPWRASYNVEKCI